MASKNASVGGLNFRIGADASGLEPGLKKAEKAVKDSADRMTKTQTAAIKAIEKTTGGGTDAGMKNRVEGLNKLATAGGVSGLGPIAALGSLGPAAIAAGGALAILGGAAKLCTEAFDEFQKDSTKNATNAVAAGSYLDDFGNSLKEVATEGIGDFIGALTGGGLDARREALQSIRDNERASAEMNKKFNEREAAKKAAEQSAVVEAIAELPQEIQTALAPSAEYGSASAASLVSKAQESTMREQTALLRRIATAATTPKIVEF